MTVRNKGWLDANALRRYPVDDTATGTDDNGLNLADDILLDLRLRWPSALGRYAFVGGITITNRVLTVVFVAADSPTTAGTFTPLASVTILQPVNRHQYYPVTPLQDGVGGFVVFGDVTEPCVFRFSSPQQSLLSPRVAEAYEALPIAYLGKYGRDDQLTGIVQLVGGNDIEISKEEITYDGETKDAIVIRVADPIQGQNALAKYIGPCDTRPESGTCDRAAIETINGVTPDCDGNISIVFRNMTVAPYQSCGDGAAGVVLDQPLGLTDVCGTATDDYPGSDYCFGTISSSSASPPASSSSSSGGAVDPNPPGSSEACEELPFLDCFDMGAHASWRVRSGSARLTAVDSPDEPLNCGIPLGDMCSSISIAPGSSSSYCFPSSYTPVSQSLQLYNTTRRNAVTWENCGLGSSLAKTVRTHLQLTSAGAVVNGGVVLNYHIADPLTSPHLEYFVVQLNRDENRVEVLRYNGVMFVLEYATSPAWPFNIGDWFDLEVTATDAGSGNVNIAVSLANVTNPAWPAVSFNMLTARWGDDDGYYGLHTSRAVTNFSFWSIADA